MCGHVGVFGLMTPTLLWTFEDLINMDLVRGLDSTGIAFVKPRGDTYILKDTCLPYELFRDENYPKQMGAQNIGLIGHNRSATKGKISVQNAHPFTHGHITLAHNGTLKGQHRLTEHERFDTDSENLCYSISKLGVEATWKATEGAATLVWWDAKEKKLNFLSNGQRPFHYVYANKGTAIIWSSDKNLLKFAVEKNGVKLARNGEVFELKDDELFSCHIGKKHQLFFQTKKLEPFRFYVDRSNETYIQGKGWVKRDEPAANSNSSSTRQLTFVDRNKKPVLPTKPILCEADWHKQYDACAFCQQSLRHEYGIAVEMDDSNAACADCAATAYGYDIDPKLIANGAL